MNGKAPSVARRKSGDLARILRSGAGDGCVEEGEGVWRYGAAGVVPECVVRPRDRDGVVAVLRTVAERGAAVIPCGNATHLDIGWPPRRYDVALSTTALDRVVDHEVADMTVTVEAGVTLAAVNRRLADSGQWLPFDPPCADEMTIGGLVAADRAGPLRLSHGKVRDLLIGVRVVTADGELIRGGGRVVKNVAGYDLPKLFAGSFGTLGVIVEATFKVRPRPAATAVHVWPAHTLAEALRNGRAVLDGPLFPSLVEAVNDAGAESVGLSAGAALVVGFAGEEDELNVQGERLAALSRGAAERTDPVEAEALGRALRDFSVPGDEDALVARLSTLPTKLEPLLSRTEAEAAARGLVLEVQGHVGSGVACVQVLGAAEPQAPAWLAEWLRVLTRQHGAWVVFERVPATLRETVDPWGLQDPSARLMAEVKRALDGRGVLAPGRFVGRI